MALPDSSRVVIGTAGHVDHGKTALVRALTGQDTDRLPAEKARGISIDLGFADLVLPSGRKASIVDVPGHERFIRNMLAGASGIDLVLLVVAADDGVMPQTREHLDILRFLEVGAGVVALTKADLADDDWLDLVEEEVREGLRGTFMEDAPLVRVSALTGEGLPRLLTVLDGLANGVKREGSRAFSRLPVDRVFSVPGFGTVVTGTLVAGSIRVEDRLESLPLGKVARVRGLEVHGAKVEEAVAGSRTAVNLAGLEAEQVGRGDVLAAPGRMRATKLFAGRLTLLPGTQPLASGTRVHLHAGTAETAGRIILLDTETLEPGCDGMIRFRAEKPLVVESGDCFVVRSYSPVTTIGGGRVLDPASRHKRFREADLEALARREDASPEQLILLALEGKDPVTRAELARRVGLADAALGAELDRLVGEGKVRPLAGTWYLSPGGLAAAGEAAGKFLTDFHRREPLRSGVGKEEVRSRLFPALDGKVWNALTSWLAQDGYLEERQERLALPGHRVELTEAAGRVRDELESLFRKGGVSPPPQAEALKGLPVGPREALDILNLLLEEGILVRLSEEVVWHRVALDEAVGKLRVALATTKNGLAPSEVRDLLGTSRRHAVPLLEYLDGVRMTRRMGDKRVLVKRDAHEASQH